MSRLSDYLRGVATGERLSVWGSMLLVIALGLVLFTGSLRAPLTGDDIYVTIENHQAYDPANIPRYFIHDADWLNLEQTSPDEEEASRFGLYRPLLVTSYTIDALLYGEDAFGWRVTNLLLHLLASLLVLGVTLRLTRSRLGALVAGLVFVAHPIHTEAVATLIGGRSGMLACVFVLAACLVFFGREEVTWPRAFGSAGFLALGLFSKENAVVIPGILVLVGWGLLGYSIRHLLWRISPHIGVLLLYTTARLAIVGRLESADWSVAFGDASGVEIFLTVMLVEAWYFWLALVPYPLQFQTCYQHQALAASPAAGVWSGLFILGLLTVAAWRVVAGRRAGRPSMWATCLLLFYFCLIPVSHLVPFFVVMAERFLYLPSVALAVLLGWLARRGHQLRPWLPIAVGLPLLVVYCLGTATRNADWVDLDRLWGKTAACAPDSPDPQSLMGTARLRRGEPAEAMPFLERAAALAPRDPAAHYNLGLAHQQLGRARAAEVAYRRALQFDSNHSKALNNLGALVEQRGELLAARGYFERAVRVDPGHPASAVNLANVEMELGHLEEAERLFRLAIKIAPRSPEARFNLARLFARSGRVADAEALYRQVLARHPDHAMAHNNLANILSDRSQTADARSHLLAALVADPDCGPAHYNLGNLLMSSGQASGAAGHYARAVELQPDDVEPLLGLGYARLQLGQSMLAKKSADLALAMAPEDPRVARLQALIAQAPD